MLDNVEPSGVGDLKKISFSDVGLHIEPGVVNNGTPTTLVGDHSGCLLGSCATPVSQARDLDGPRATSNAISRAAEIPSAKTTTISNETNV